MSRQFNKQFASGQAAVKDPVFGATFDWGTTVPTDGTAGYAPGCLFLDVDALIGSELFVNEGTATSCDFNAITTRESQASTGIVTATTALTVTPALHSFRTININSATGFACTLPAMTGTGNRYRFVIGTTVSSGNHTIVATGAHLFGSVTQNTDTANGTSGFTAGVIANATGITTITLDGTTRGGRKGDWIEIEDVATSFGVVRGNLNASGAEATPFS